MQLTRLAGIISKFHSLCLLALNVISHPARLALVAALLFCQASFCTVGRAWAQTNPNTDQGMKPYDSLHGGALDSISMTGGNVFFHKELYSAAQRGRVGLTISMQYNNKGVHLLTSCNGTPPKQTCSYRWIWNGSGVSLVRDQNLFASGRNVDTGQTNGTSEIFTTIYSATTSDGATHQLANTGNGYRSIDGSGIFWDGTSLSALDRSGVYDGTNGTSAVDPNGNSISANTPADAWTDTLGRVVPWSTTTSAASLSSCPQLNLPYQPLTSASLWSVPGPTGTSQFTLCYASVYVHSNFYTGACYSGQSSGAFDVCQSTGALQSVVLPDGTAWTFEYDGANPNDSTSRGYGDLLRIGFPTGGSISYTYATLPMYQGYYQPNMQTTESRTVTSRTVDANDGSGPHTWKYLWTSKLLTSTTTAYQVENTVTDPLGNDTVHQITGFFGGTSLYETQTRFYQGSQSSGTLMKTVKTDYSFSSNPFDNLGPNVNPPTAINVEPVRVTTILPNGLQSKVETDYDSAFTFHDPSWGLPINPPQSYQTAMYAGTLGTVSARREYDNGAGAPGNLLNQTFTTYLWQNNSNYLSANMLDLPATVVVQDGNGNKVAETDSTYDEPQYLTPSNITTQHGAAPNPSPVRGNPTTVSRWLNTSTNPVVSHTNWYDTGEVYQSIDPLGNITTHSYDPYYAGAYSTKTCNALSQCISGTYDFNSGLLTSLTDANASSQASGNTQGDAAHTSNYAYDSMLRMTSAILPPDPAGQRPETDFSYPDANTMQRMRKQTGSSSIVDYAYFDGLGRTKQTRLVDPEGDDFVDTTYDTLGRTSTVSNPHRSTASPTDGITTNQYDALGRVTQVTRQDSSIVTTQYDETSANSADGDCSTTTDEAGKLRKSCVDGLGRLVEVDEPGPGNNVVGAAATGTIIVSGAEQSTAVLNTAATRGTGSFTVNGAEQTGFVSVCNTTCIRQKETDGGRVSVTVNGVSESVTYGGASTDNSVAQGLTNAFNKDGNSPVTATVSGATVTVTAGAPGAGSNYSWSTTSQTTSPYFSDPSFWVTPNGGNLTGGSDATYNTVYDQGTLTITVNGSDKKTVSFNSSSTASSLATAIQQAFNGDSLVTAQVSNANSVVFTSITQSPSADYSVTTSSTWQSQYFSNPSFTVSGATLTGGTTAGGLYAAYQTLYTYDALSNLLSVNQKGDGSQAARIRNFTYDSLSRLLTATNPESGQISYSYDADGNVLQKTSPTPNQTGTTTQTISTCYDALNRVTGKAYLAQNCPLSTPVVTYAYDAGTNGIGHLTSLTDQAGSGSYSYDALSRIASESRTIAGVSKGLSYSYNLDNSINTLTYPSGAVLSYSYSTAGRAGAAQDTTNNIGYVSGTGGAPALATHAPDGSLATYINGITSTFTGISTGLQYNSRRQLCRITALTTGALPASCTDSTHTGNVLDLGYNLNLGTSDNGNVVGITNYRDNTRSQSFTYDALNRLTSAQNTGTDCTQKTVNGETKYWGNNYSYDPWGNLLGKNVTKCSAENLSVTALANNQLSGYSYDAAGNMTHDVTTGNNYTYDAENRITGAAGFTYTYDADGNRVEKSNGSTGTIYWYMSPGIVAESDLSGNLTSEYAFFNGRRTARKDFPSNAVSYYFSDNLGTASVITNSAGTITEDEDFYPWGGELPFVNGDSNHYKYEGHERDGETGLDYFGRRHYGNWLGRFTSADPLHFQASMLTDPQRFNLYAFVRNNPLRLVDPNGKSIQLPDDDKKRAETLQGIKGAVGKQAGAYLYDNAVTKTDVNGNTKTEHYVGIYTNGPDGKGPSFSSINQNASEIGAVIGNQDVVHASTVPNGTIVSDDRGGSVRIGPIPDSPGATYMHDGQLRISVLEPATDPGKLPGSIMSDGKPGKIDQGMLWGHEFGHGAFAMGAVWGGSFNQNAVDLENNVRKAEDPNAATRTQH